MSYLFNRQAAQTPTVVEGTEDVSAADVFGSDNLVWEVNDRFSQAVANRIYGPDGESTSWAMVYGRDPETKDWAAVKPVSDKYQPISTETMVDIAAERWDLDIDDIDFHTDFDRAGTMVKVTIPFGDRFDLLGSDVSDEIASFDAGSDITRFADSQFGMPGGGVTKLSMELRNDYAGLGKAFFGLGFFRMICTNGMIVMDEGLVNKSVHTVNSLRDFLAHIGTADIEAAKDRVRRLPQTKLTEEQIEGIQKSLPKKRHKELQEAIDSANGTAWGAYNFLTYLRTHEYTVSRSPQLDRPIQAVFAAAA